MLISVSGRISCLLSSNEAINCTATKLVRKMLPGRQYNCDYGSASASRQFTARSFDTKCELSLNNVQKPTHPLIGQHWTTITSIAVKWYLKTEKQVTIPIYFENVIKCKKEGQCTCRCGIKNMFFYALYGCRTSHYMMIIYAVCFGSQLITVWHNNMYMKSWTIVVVGFWLGELRDISNLTWSVIVVKYKTHDEITIFLIHELVKSSCWWSSQISLQKRFRKWNDGVLGLFCAHCLG